MLTRCTTGPDGTLRLPAGPKGLGFIVWARVASRWLRVCDAPPSKQSVDLGDVSIATYDLRGTVVDARGLPAANVPVTASGSFFLSTLSDTNGAFRIEGIPLGDFTVRAEDPVTDGIADGIADVPTTMTTNDEELDLGTLELDIDPVAIAAIAPTDGGSRSLRLLVIDLMAMTI